MGKKGLRNRGLEKNTLWSAMISHLSVYYSRDQIKKYEMGGTRSMYGEEKRWIREFGMKN